MVHDPDNNVFEHTHGMSDSSVISFLCEDLLLKGDELDLATLKTQVLILPRHARVSLDVASGLCIKSVLQHVTCLAICGDMHHEATQSMRAMPSSASTALGSENWWSWISLQKCMRLGEMIRVSFLLEDNMKKRRILPDECIKEVVRDVVGQVRTVVAKMQCAGGQTMLMTINQRKNAATPSNLQPFTKMVGHIMIELIDTAILCTDPPAHANNTYGLLRINLLDLYCNQYMQWQHTSPGNLGGRNERLLSHRHENVCHIQEKKKLMMQTIHQHGRQMVYEPVQKMVTTVSGLV